MKWLKLSRALIHALKNCPWINIMQEFSQSMYSTVVSTQVQISRINIGVISDRLWITIDAILKSKRRAQVSHDLLFNRKRVRVEKRIHHFFLSFKTALMSNES
uniref:Uncharacterized protein n=1 Tax=Opuntia streptacantha TaxID=393608 RepID=A0A7C9CJ35_OPUST